MRLTDNNRILILTEVHDRIYTNEYSIRVSSNLLINSQNFIVRGQISSNYLLDNIYDEIRG